MCDTGVDVEMSRFESGVKYYTTAKAEITVHFPEDKTICQYCPYCRNGDSLKRWKCYITNEYLLFPFNTVGNLCPLKFEEGEKDSE